MSTSPTPAPSGFVQIMRSHPVISFCLLARAITSTLGLGLWSLHVPVPDASRIFYPNILFFTVALSLGVSVLTAEFRDALAKQFQAIRFAGASVFVPQPIQNKTTAELHQVAEQSFAEVAHQITSGP